MITDGFFRTNYAKGLAGAVVVAVVALALELLAAATQRAVDPNPRESSRNRKRGILGRTPRVRADAEPIGG